MPEDNKKTLYCSLCSKSQHKVRTLIDAAPVFICDECIELCKSITSKTTYPLSYATTIMPVGEVMDNGTCIDTEWLLNQIGIKSISIPDKILKLDIDSFFIEIAKIINDRALLHKQKESKNKREAKTKLLSALKKDLKPNPSVVIKKFLKKIEFEIIPP